MRFQLTLIVTLIKLTTETNVLNWYAPFLSGGGYCSEATAFASAITKYGPNLSLSLYHHGDSINNDYMGGLTEDENNLLRKNLVTYSSNIPDYAVTVCHSEPGAWHAPTPRYHTQRCPPQTSIYKIGRTMFETDKIPEGWVQRLNFMDEIWVPTEFSKSIFISEGITDERIHIIGEPIDTDFFAPKASKSFVTPESLRNIPEDHFVFLFVGKWEERKGIQILIKAYFQEFSIKKEKVILIILTNAYHSTNDFEKEISKFIKSENLLAEKMTDKNVSPKYLILSNLSQKDLVSLYSLANVLVIPSRGEGWGRPHVEAMSCGVPVIATNWSGPTEFLNEDNGFPLRISGLVESNHWKGHKWAEPDLDHLRHLLRFTVSHPEETLRRGKRARRDMVAKYSLPVMAGIVNQEILRISEKLKSKVKDHGVSFSSKVSDKNEL